MYEISVMESFSAAHYLPEYHGKCERLHGHNYKVKVSVQSKQLNKGGMVIDFGVLKDELKKILDPLDHCFLNELKEFSDRSPSAEWIAFHIYIKLKEALKVLKISAVEIFETDKNIVTYYPD